MASGLVVSGGGSSAVATDELFAQSSRLSHLAAELHECLAALGAVDHLVTAQQLMSLGAPQAVLTAERTRRDAGHSLSRAAAQAGEMRVALDLSARAYGLAERNAEGLLERVAAQAAWFIGAALPPAALLLLPAIATFGAGIIVGLGVLPPEERKRLEAGAERLLRQHAGMLTDPRTVELVRLMIMSTDDFGAGLVHVPAQLTRILGDEGLGVLGLAVSSRVVVGLANRGGALVESPVAVSQAGKPKPTAAPTGFEQRAERIPTGESQIRIDRYARAGEPDRFEVYIEGTRNLSPISGEDPWDMTSNLTTLAGEDSGSFRAVEEAMRQAGVDSTTPIVLTGHSQGGLIAAQLAACGDYDVRGLVTLGGPVGEVPVPHDVTYVAFEHSDDLVPALGGAWKSAQPIIASREVFAGRPVDTSIPFPAHQLSAYEQTAALADDAGDPRLVGAGQSLRNFDAGATSITSTYYTAERVAR